MGLGKTMSVLGLILSNQLAPEFYDVNPTKDDTVFRSRGTLVICPNHLVKQWKEELEKNTKPPIKVIPISTIAHLKKIKYQDLVETGTKKTGLKLRENRGNSG
jgi:SNF2 family DNA or RNA helicase